MKKYPKKNKVGRKKENQQAETQAQTVSTQAQTVSQTVSTQVQTVSTLDLDQITTFVYRLDGPLGEGNV